MPLVDTFYAMSRTRALLTGAAMFGAVVVLDYSTATELSLTSLYLLIVIFVTWNCGIHAGATVAVASALVQVALVFEARHAYSHPFYFWWDAFNRLFGYAVACALTARLRQMYVHEHTRARVDPLTGLLNRASLYESLDTEIRRQGRTGRPLSVAYIDCDDFKAINDKFGHEAGDRLIRQTANIARSTLRSTDVVARLGGDEFVILLPELEAEGARYAIKKLHRSLCRGMCETGFDVRFSVGLMTFDLPVQSGEAAVSACDALMYKAKAAGKNRIVHQVYPTA